MGYMNDLITIKDLALKFRLSERSIRRYIKADPNFPVMRIGGLLRFDYEEVYDYMKKREETAV